MSGFTDEFWELVCEFDRQLYVLFVLVVLLFILALFSLLFVSAEASSIVLQIDFLILGTLLVSLVAVLGKCRRK